MLHCGDLTYCDSLSSYKKAVKMPDAIDAELKLAIADNHDLDLDKKYWDSHLYEDEEPEYLSRAVEIVKGFSAAEAGVKYLEEAFYVYTPRNGTRFTFYACAFCDWAFVYEHDQDRFNEAHQVAEGVNSISKYSTPAFPNVDYPHDPRTTQRHPR